MLGLHDDFENITGGLYIPRVLLIEDDPATRWLVRSALKKDCILSTVTAEDNYLLQFKAVNRYVAFSPDLVILDIDLSPADGKDVLKDIMLVDPDAYVVMFSSHNSEENIRDTIEKGAKGFIAKPFRKEELLDYLYDSQFRKIG